MPQRGGDGFAYAGIGGGGHLFLFVAFLRRHASVEVGGGGDQTEVAG